jgi:hypothetical protein
MICWQIFYEHTTRKQISEASGYDFEFWKRQNCVENDEVVGISESDDGIPTLPMSRDENPNQATALWVEMKRRFKPCSKAVRVNRGGE